MARLLACVFLVLLPVGSATVRAQDRHLELRFAATRRAQIAVWIESADGAHFRTLALTQAVALWGIGNRPGALQMNSGHHWPYGRREGVLPVWAHRRYEHEGDAWRLVIFDGRASEGHASSADSISEPLNTPDPHFCLSFTGANNDIELDGMTCASVFMSNKGRYMTADDVASGYAEPFVADDGSPSMRALPLTSLYPPRRDVLPCSGGRCEEHGDVANYAADAAAVLPELDAVTMATPAEGAEQLVLFDLPEDWPEGDYTVFVEVNVEGDYAPGWDASARPTPRAPTGRWDSWAMTYGYPYRGQPSVVYEVPVSLVSSGGVFVADGPAGYGALHGEDGTLSAMDGTIADDPALNPGSGADRLLEGASGHRVTVTVPAWDICSQPEPPADCGAACSGMQPCAAPLLCGEAGTCVGMCEVNLALDGPEALTLGVYPDERHSHHWATMAFVVPELPRGLLGWEVRVSSAPIVDEESFLAGRPAQAADLGDVALVVPRTRPDGSPLVPGDVIELELGGLAPLTRYHVGVRAIDACSERSAIAVAELETTEIHFTTVSPCFVATAAYGSPLDARIGALRRLRDRYLRTSGPGRWLLEGYEAIGPALAAVIREDDEARASARAALEPVVAVAEWLTR